MIGACCTRDAFNKKFVSNWRDFVSLEMYYFQPSIISIVSEPIPFCRKDLCQSVRMQTRWEDMLSNELNKDYLDNIISLAPDAIIIDFYSDVINGVIPINGYSYITNRSNDWKDNDTFRKLQKGGEFRPYNSADYFELWKRSYNKLIKIIKSFLPDTMIIVNSCRCMIHYEKDGEILNYNTSKIPDIGKLNKIWNDFDEYARKCGAITITYDKEYLLDANYIYGGLWIVHYKKEFYNDFFEKLKSKIVEAHALKRYISNNLIINGNLNNQSLFYRYWDKNFYLHDNRIIVENNMDNKVPQIWSNLICNGNGKQKYIFSFYCIAKSPSALKKNQMVAAIRMYEKPGLLFAADCKQEIIIYLSDAQIDSGIWEKVDFEFVVDAPYFSCGLAVGPGVNVEYRELSCHIKAEQGVLYNDSIVERELLDDSNILIDVNETYVTSIKQLNSILE